MRRRTAVGAVLVLTGGCLLGTGLSAQSMAPTPAAAAGRGPETHAVVAAAPIGPAAPVGIDIVSIGVHTSVGSVGLAPDGTIQVPRPGPDYGVPGWYRYSPTPGERGPAVIIGHLDTPHAGPSVFFRLGELTPGQQIQIRRADGRIAVFEITGIAAYAKRLFPTGDVFGNADHAALRLITCGGPIDPATGHYRDNTVVFATLVATRSP